MGRIVLVAVLAASLTLSVLSDACYDRFGEDETRCKSQAENCQWIETAGRGKCVMAANTVGRDSCYTRFGENETMCKSEADTCQWLERAGRGKCVMAAKREAVDSCYERFGENQARCNSQSDTCEWIERAGRGKCVMAAKREAVDSCYERFGENEVRCKSQSETCQWIERAGRGKCLIAAKMEALTDLSSKKPLQDDGAIGLPVLLKSVAVFTELYFSLLACGAIFFVTRVRKQLMSPASKENTSIDTALVNDVEQGTAKVELNDSDNASVSTATGTLISTTSV